tara:strand:- start:909 stop:1115 length:207 start_codon:yes stop_codon:yes gene_type:complete
MSFRDTVKEWIDKGFTPPSNPLCSKRLVIKNLKEILNLLENESTYLAADRIKFLISDIENDKLKPGNL